MLLRSAVRRNLASSSNSVFVSSFEANGLASVSWPATRAERFACSNPCFRNANRSGDSWSIPIALAGPLSIASPVHTPHTPGGVDIRPELMSKDESRPKAVQQMFREKKTVPPSLKPAYQLVLHPLMFRRQSRKEPRRRAISQQDIGIEFDARGWR